MWCFLLRSKSIEFPWKENKLYSYFNWIQIYYSFKIMSKGYSSCRDFYLLIMITVLLLCPDSVSLDTITIKYLWSLFNIHNFSGILSLFVSFSGLHRDLNLCLLDFSFESFKGTLPWALRSLFLIVFYVDSLCWLSLSSSTLLLGIVHPMTFCFVCWLTEQCTLGKL